MSEQKQSVNGYSEALAIGITLLRLPLAVRIARKIEKKQSIAADMTLFVLADIADGMLARKLHADTPKRRFVDAAVDRVSVLYASWAMGKANKASRPYLYGLAARELIVTAANAAHYVRTDEVVQGHGIHKLGTLSTAIFALGASTHNEMLTEASGMTATVLNYGLAIDYITNAANPHGEVRDGVRHIAFDNLKSASTQDV